VSVNDPVPIVPHSRVAICDAAFAVTGAQRITLTGVTEALGTTVLVALAFSVKVPEASEPPPIALLITYQKV
jgi:hypothetical protein